jgi:DNA-binding transcriptional regulator YiaG
MVEGCNRQIVTNGHDGQSRRRTGCLDATVPRWLAGGSVLDQPDVWSPVVEVTAALIADLAVHGVAAAVLPEGPADVRAIRTQLGLTQEQFALGFGLDVAALRNWEAGRREPDTATRSYLRVIQRAPARRQRWRNALRFSALRCTTPRNAPTGRWRRAGAAATVAECAALFRPTPRNAPTGRWRRATRWWFRARRRARRR